MRFDRKQFFDGFRPWYRSVTGDALDQEKVDALEFLLTSFENDATWTRPEEVAGSIANIHIETFVPKTNQRYLPIREFGGKAYFIRRYWNDLKIRKQLGNKSQDDAWRRCGRGYAQETGLANDVKMTHLTGVDLVNDPDLAMVPENAFKILTAGMFHGVWTRKKIGDFINDNDCDYYNLRTVINGHDRAAEIAGYAHALAKILSDALLANAPAADLAAQPTDSGLPIDKPADLNPDGTPTVDPPPADPGDVPPSPSMWERVTGWQAKVDQAASIKNSLNPFTPSLSPISGTSGVAAGTTKITGIGTLIHGMWTQSKAEIIIGGCLIVAGLIYLAIAKWHALERFKAMWNWAAEKAAPSQVQKVTVNE